MFDYVPWGWVSELSFEEFRLLKWQRWLTVLLTFKVAVLFVVCSAIVGYCEHFLGSSCENIFGTHQKNSCVSKELTAMAIGDVDDIA